MSETNQRVVADMSWPVGDDTDDVTECGSCGSPLVYFDPCDGWSCHGCGRNDSDG